MWIGNVMLLVLNLPLVGWWARLAHVPYRYLYPTTVALSCTGIYALSHGTVDLLLAALFGVTGYLLKTRGFEAAPLLLGFVLSPPIRDNLNRTLVFANGDVTTFFEHPLSAALLAIAAASLLVTALPAISIRARFSKAEDDSDCNGERVDAEPLLRYPQSQLISSVTCSLIRRLTCLCLSCTWLDLLQYC